MSDTSPLKKLLITFPSLLNLKGASLIFQDLTGQNQTPLVYANYSEWTRLRRDQELRTACELLFLELTKDRAHRTGATPTIGQMDRFFKRAGCPPLSYFLFKLGLCEHSYRKLLILANLPLNRNFSSPQKQKKRTDRQASASSKKPG